MSLYPNLWAQKRTVPPWVRREVAHRYGIREPGDEAVAQCEYCDTKTDIWWDEGGYISFNGFVLDHIIPFSRGGRTDGANLTLSCRWCNYTKHDKTALEFKERRR